MSMRLFPVTASRIYVPSLFSAVLLILLNANGLSRKQKPMQRTLPSRALPIFWKLHLLSYIRTTAIYSGYARLKSPSSSFGTSFCRIFNSLFSSSRVQKISSRTHLVDYPSRRLPSPRLHLRVLLFTTLMRLLICLRYLNLCIIVPLAIWVLLT